MHSLLDVLASFLCFFFISQWTAERESLPARAALKTYPCACIACVLSFLSIWGLLSMEPYPRAPERGRTFASASITGVRSFVSHIQLSVGALLLLVRIVVSLSSSSITLNPCCIYTMQRRISRASTRQAPPALGALKDTHTSIARSLNNHTHPVGLAYAVRGSSPPSSPSTRPPRRLRFGLLPPTTAGGLTAPAMGKSRAAAAAGVPKVTSLR